VCIYGDDERLLLPDWLAVHVVCVEAAENFEQVAREM
jgi:hypothetical protein